MTTQTIYQWVKASERLPKRNYKGIIKSDFGMIYGTSFFYRAYDKGRINIDQWYWLRETTAILLTPEQAEAYEKCMEIVQELAITDRIYEVTALTKQAKQALHQLNKVKP